MYSSLSIEHNERTIAGIGEALQVWAIVQSVRNKAVQYIENV
jgi:hypothetical protein